MNMSSGTQNLPLVVVQKRIWSLLQAGALLVGLLLGPVAVVAADNAINELQRYLDNLRSFQARFEQVLLDETGAVIEQAKGTLALARPGRFRWDYREPYSQLIVADGEHVWIYDQELDQVTVKELGQAVGDTPALLLTSESALEERFLVRSAGKRNGLEWVSLEPKSSDVSFSEIRLGLERGELKRMELVDSFGQTTKLYFHEIVLNAPVSAELFSFTPPTGVDVIGDRPARPRP